MHSPSVRRVGRITLVAVLLVGSYGLRVTSAASPGKEHPLAGVTQNWDKNLPNASRFSLLANFGGAAVRDNNTGLVWEQSPSTALRDWASATNDCVSKAVGGAFGWRLPSVIELNSVRDPSLPPPYVPNLFSGVQASNYWTATTVASTPDAAWDVRFLNGLVSRSSKGGNLLVWCVRGPMNADAY